MAEVSFAPIGMHGYVSEKAPVIPYLFYVQPSERNRRRVEVL
jgi:hypothetical protein